MMAPQFPNPTSLIAWETSSSLEHACWACPTKANSPKALHSCYGIHSMPCLAYHSTMHAVGAAHRCSACVSGREVHESRHRVIAQLVADYHTVESESRVLRLKDRTLQERQINLPIRKRVSRGAHDDESFVNPDARSDNEENLSMLDTASSVSTCEDHSIPKPTKAEERERKRCIKAQKSMDKAARNKAKHCIQVTAEDIQRVNLILHGDQADAQLSTHPLATDKTIEDVIARNKGFVRKLHSHIQDLKDQVAQGRREEKARKQHQRRVSEGLIEDIESEPVISAILLKLGIKPELVVSTACSRHGHKLHGDLKTPKRDKMRPRSTICASPIASVNKSPSGSDHSQATKQQIVIVHKLRDAIKDDLEKHENDLRQTYIRAGAFFRYAGRQVFERMTEIASRIDVQTGEAWEKKLKRERIPDALNILTDIEG